MRNERTEFLDRLIERTRRNSTRLVGTIAYGCSRRAKTEAEARRELQEQDEETEHVGPEH
ncbi:MAG: hypothetical protein GXY85_01015 [Candidatus Brocadiaceae bacterium]|nr:hypothetical protein [Candidatus Brocadiaceae bacterium]